MPSHQRLAVRLKDNPFTKYRSEYSVSYQRFKWEGGEDAAI